MRLLVVCALAMAGWAAAAPGPISGNEEAPEDLQHESDSDDLAPAISELARRKRGSSKANLPYSKYRPSGGMHRYRYPLYRKRSYRPSYDYDDESAILLPESFESDYFDYDNHLRGPSLFRERGHLQERKKKMMLEDEGYFSDDLLPDGVDALPTAFGVPLKKDSGYNLANAPYDLQAIGRLYEMGKRDDAAYNLEGLNQIHSVGRKNPPRMVMTPTEQFYDAIDAIRRKKAMFNDRIMSPIESEKLEQLVNLKNFLTSAAANRYLHSYYNDQNGMAFKDPMIRRKRDTANAPVDIPKDTAKTNATGTQKGLEPSKTSSRHQEISVPADRRKREFNDYFNWERQALESEDGAYEKRNDDDQKDLNDFLTREYFKSIARSVGQKKKRMAYAQFEADKRSAGIDEFLENPSMLEYMQSKLAEAEKEVAMEAEKELENGNSEELLSNIVVRLDALERMREALGRLEELQNAETARHQRSKPSAVSKKSVSASNSSHAVVRPVAVKVVGAAPAKKRSNVDNLKKKKKSAAEARRIRRMRKEEEDALPALFLGNTREDCPVLDRVLLNCLGVSKIVGDEDQAFLGACLRHEVCYMCGSSLSITGHECDAILSSSLEASCIGNLDCLSAAGETFNLLSNAERYDDDGTCTHDPCVRQFLESR